MSNLNGTKVQRTRGWVNPKKTLFEELSPMLQEHYPIYKKGITTADAAKLFGVARGTIHNELSILRKNGYDIKMLPDTSSKKKDKKSKRKTSKAVSYSSSSSVEKYNEPLDKQIQLSQKLRSYYPLFTQNMTIEEIAKKMGFVKDYVRQLIRKYEAKGLEVNISWDRRSSRTELVHVKNKVTPIEILENPPVTEIKPVGFTTLIIGQMSFHLSSHIRNVYISPNSIKVD